MQFEGDSRLYFPSPTAGLRLVLLVFLGIQASGMLLAYGGVMEGISRVGYYGVLLAQQVLFLGIPALYCMRRPAMRITLRTRRLGAGTCVCIALGAIACVPAMSALNALWTMLLLSGGLQIQPSPIPLPRDGLDLVVGVLIIGGAPALCEELVFRGALFSSQEGQGTRRAWLVSSLLFGLMHGQFSGLPTHVALGMLLGGLLVGYGSLWAPMLFHAVYNGATMLWAYAASSLQDAAQAEDALAELAGMPAAWVFSFLVSGLFFAAIAACALAIPALRLRARGKPPVYPHQGISLTWQASALLAVLVGLFALQYAASYVQMLPVPGV